MTFETNSAFEACTHIRKQFGYHKLEVKENGFEYFERTTMLEDIRVWEMSFPSGVVVKDYEKDDYFTFTLTLNGQLCYFLNQEERWVKNGAISVIDGEELPNFIIDAQTNLLILQIPKFSLIKAAHQTLGYQPVLKLTFPMLNVSALAFNTIQNFVLDTLSIAASQRCEMLRQRFIRKSANYLKSLVLMTIHNSYQVLFHSLSEGEAYSPISRATKYLQENLHQDINLASLSEASGMSTGNLNYQFKKLTGFSPMKYLKELRLIRLNEVLKASDSKTNILETAMELGLNHPGRLAKEYAERFNELPSQTLRHSVTISKK